MDAHRFREKVKVVEDNSGLDILDLLTSPEIVAFHEKIDNLWREVEPAISPETVPDVDSATQIPEEEVQKLLEEHRLLLAGVVH
jgi:hypothetical protein